MFDLICSRPFSKPNTVQTKPVLENQQSELESDRQEKKSENDNLALQGEKQLEKSKDENFDLSSNGVIQRLCSKCESEINESEQDTPLQTKLSISAPGDKYQKEADTISARVMSISQATNHLAEDKNKQPEDSIQRKPLAYAVHPLIQRQRELREKQCQPKPIPTSVHPLIQRQRELHQKSIQKQPIQQTRNPACRATNRRAGTEHELIQSDYIVTKDPTGAREYSIPGGSESGGIGYADIVGLGTHAIYEIKPYTLDNITSGLVQVNRYLQAARANCDPTAPWHLGFAYPDTVLQMVNRELVAKQYGHPGLILYYTRQRQRRTAPDPVPVPSQERQQQQQRNEINWENVFQVVVGLGLSVALVATVLYALLSPEPATKLAAAGLSATMIVFILNHFGIQDSSGQI